VLKEVTAWMYVYRRSVYVSYSTRMTEFRMNFLHVFVLVKMEDKYLPKANIKLSQTENFLYS